MLFCTYYAQNYASIIGAGLGLATAVDEIKVFNSSDKVAKFKMFERKRMCCNFVASYVIIIKNFNFINGSAVNHSRPM